MSLLIVVTVLQYYLCRALSISFFSWLASLICDVTLARKSSKLDKRSGSSRLSCAHKLRTSARLRGQNEAAVFNENFFFFDFKETKINSRTWLEIQSNT